LNGFKQLFQIISKTISPTYFISRTYLQKLAKQFGAHARMKPLPDSGFSRVGNAHPTANDCIAS